MGISFSKETLAKAGFQEGQDLQVLAAAGMIAITAEPQVELTITAEEARAISEEKWDSLEMQSVREKILKKLKPLNK